MKTYNDIKKHAFIGRGLPGSGKSHVLNQFKEVEPSLIICSADDFFINDEGEYDFNPYKLSEAHQWCLEKWIKAIRQGRSVVLDNTNTVMWEYKNYILIAEMFDYEITVLNFNRPEHTDELLAERNTHGVPLAGITRMRERWEDDPREEFLD